MTQDPLHLKNSTTRLIKRCETDIPYSMVKDTMYQALRAQFIEKLPLSAIVELWEKDSIIAQLSNYDPEDGEMYIHVEWEEEL